MIHYSFGCPVYSAYVWRRRDGQLEEARRQYLANGETHTIVYNRYWPEVDCRTCRFRYHPSRLVRFYNWFWVRGSWPKLPLALRKKSKYLSFLPLVLCFFCPAHLYLLAAALGFGIHTTVHHEEWWHILVLVLLGVLGFVLSQRMHHRHSGKGHTHGCKHL